MSMIDRISQVEAKFNAHSDWEDKYRELIKVGKNLSGIDEKNQVSKYEIKGCQSKVWLKPNLVGGRVIFQADSDAILVKGIIGLLLEVYSDSTPEEILAHPPQFLTNIGITDHLSLNRTNGLRSMVKQIQTYASLFQSLISKGLQDADI